MTQLPEVLHAPATAMISIGSNVDRERSIAEGVRRLNRHRGIEVLSVGPVFESDAVGGDYPAFFNCALKARTYLEPEELRAELRSIEDEMGRVRSDDKNAPRNIDLDVSYYGDLVATFDEWAIPDPEAAEYAHIAVPIAACDPTFVDPATGLTVAELAAKIGPSAENVRPVSTMQLSAPHVARGADDMEGYVGEVYAPRFESLVRSQLVELGENPDREGLSRTPLRVAKALDYLTSGYTQSIDDVVNNAIFDAEGASEMVLVKDIEYYSMCEHHMLPFFGRAAVAYLPKGKIIGLSKLARIVDLFGRRLQVQERMTNQIADAVVDILEPHGAAVVLEGKHFCMMMRGVQKQDSWMITSAMRGTFISDSRTRAEFLDLKG